MKNEKESGGQKTFQRRKKMIVITKVKVRFLVVFFLDEDDQKDDRDEWLDLQDPPNKEITKRPSLMTETTLLLVSLDECHRVKCMSIEEVVSTFVSSVCLLSR